MSALAAGTRAPDFSALRNDGKTFSLKNELAGGPVVLAFFKVSCPVCQYAFSFFERLFQNYSNRGVTLVGVSENDAGDTHTFCRKFGVTFPVLLEDTKSFPVSNAYGLTNVPTLLWIGQDGKIEISSVGWNRKDLEAVGRKMAERQNEKPAVLIRPGEQVADFKAG